MSSFLNHNCIINHIKKNAIVSHSQSETNVSVLQTLYVAVQPLFETQNFSQDLICLAFWKRRKSSNADSAYSMR